MEGWMIDGQTGGRIDGWMDGWVDGWMVISRKIWKGHLGGWLCMQEARAWVHAFG